MTPISSALLAALAAAVIGGLLHRRSLARRAGCRRLLAAFLAEHQPGMSLVDAGRSAWRLESAAGPLATVDAKVLTRAVHGAGEARRRRLLQALADTARQGPRPFAGEFDLKRHGSRTLPRLADEGLGMLAFEAAARHADPAAGGLPTIYQIDGEPRPVYVTDAHLAAAGIDARDLHGVALAVLRQRFDESLPRRALAGGEALAIDEPDGCGGSRLLLLPEALAAGELLFAAAPAPSLLLVAARREILERAVAELAPPAAPLPPAVFRVTAGGLDKES